MREGFFRKDEFQYDAGRDAYVCPAGQLLMPIRHGRLRDLAKIDYGNPKVCRVCPLRARCTNDVRSVSRLENEDALDRMAERLRGEAPDSRPSPRDRRAPLRQHQTMDVSGCVADARPRQCPRRVQPDCARLQLAPSAQHSRRRADDGGASLVKAVTARDSPTEPAQAAAGST